MEAFRLSKAALALPSRCCTNNPHQHCHLDRHPTLLGFTLNKVRFIQPVGVLGHGVAIAVDPADHRSLDFRISQLSLLLMENSVSPGRSEA